MWRINTALLLIAVSVACHGEAPTDVEVATAASDAASEKAIAAGQRRASGLDEQRVGAGCLAKFNSHTQFNPMGAQIRKVEMLPEYETGDAIVYVDGFMLNDGSLSPMRIACTVLARSGTVLKVKAERGRWEDRFSGDYVVASNFQAPPILCPSKADWDRLELAMRNDDHSTSWGECFMLSDASLEYKVEERGESPVCHYFVRIRTAYPIDGDQDFYTCKDSWRS